MPGDRLFGFKSAAGSLITPFLFCYYGNPHAKSGLSLLFKFRLVISGRSAASLTNIVQSIRGLMSGSLETTLR